MARAISSAGESATQESIDGNEVSPNIVQMTGFLLRILLEIVVTTIAWIVCAPVILFLAAFDQEQTFLESAKSGFQTIASAIRKVFDLPV